MQLNRSEKVANVHINRIRLRSAAVNTWFTLKVKELRHILKCKECMDAFSELRDKFSTINSEPVERAR